DSTGRTGASECIAFTPDGNKLISGGASGDHSLRVWNARPATKAAASAGPLSIYQGHTAKVQKFVPLPDNLRVVSGGSDKTVRLWEIAKAKEVCVFGPFDDDIVALFVAPDGKSCLAADGKNVHLLSFETKQKAATLALPGLKFGRSNVAA